jgi:antitoxin component YwqK of YwqJK toxin-antitoxin module/peroxiredoxin
MQNRFLLVAGLGLAAVGCKFLAQQIIDYSETWSSGLPKSRGSLAGGLQAGDWVYYYESGRPRAKGQYRNDRQLGAWTYYYESGVVERAGAFDEQGLRTGEWTMQYPDQTPQARGRYVADFEDGPWQFFAADGSLERSGQFENGQLSGYWRYSYRGGRPRAEGMYWRGQRVGPWRTWDEQGRETPQDFGSRPGVQLVVETWPGGKLRRAGALHNGVAAGRWTSWHGNGEMRFCCALAGKVASGVFEARDGSGAVLAQGLLVAGAFGAGSSAVVAGAVRDIAAGPVPAAAGAEPWASGAALAALSPEASVGLFVAEVTGAVPDDALVRKAPDTAPPGVVDPQAHAVVQNIDAEPARVPAPMQPDLSPKQKQEMKDYVAEYSEGPKPTAGGSLLDKYRSTPNSPRPQGTGELKEWYGKPLPFAEMRGVDGGVVELAQYHGKRKVMIVVLRGFLGEVCCYCIAQTKALAQSRARLEQLGIEVLVVYPGARENEASFEQAYKLTFNEGGPPYRVFYDPDLALVTKLGIEGDLASPSTIVVDEQGLIRFFYKGEHRADRPAAKKLIEVIEGMSGSAKK